MRAVNREAAETALAPFGSSIPETAYAQAVSILTELFDGRINLPDAEKALRSILPVSMCECAGDGIVLREGGRVAYITPYKVKMKVEAKDLEMLGAAETALAPFRNGISETAYEQAVSILTAFWEGRTTHQDAGRSLRSILPVSVCECGWRGVVLREGDKVSYVLPEIVHVEVEVEDPEWTIADCMLIVPRQHINERLLAVMLDVDPSAPNLDAFRAAIKAFDEEDVFRAAAILRAILPRSMSVEVSCLFTSVAVYRGEDEMWIANRESVDYIAPDDRVNEAFQALRLEGLDESAISKYV